MSGLPDDDYYRGHFAKALRSETQGRLVHRRSFLATLSTLGVGLAGLSFSRPAHAQTSELVVANWGGDSLRVQKEVLAPLFEKKYPGTRVSFDTTGPTPGKIKAIVESGKTTWDVADRNIISALQLGREGLLEKVDESIVDLSAVPAELRTPWGVASYYFSYVIVYDAERFKEAAPKSWADFWDTKRFKGKRAIRNNVEGVLETALLADGVTPDKLYPLDVDRALEKVRQIKDDAIFYSNAADAQKLLRSEEASLGNLWSTRAQLLKKDTEGRVTYTFDQAILLVAAWNVLKGARNVGDAWRWVALSQDPKVQVELLEKLGWGPVNPATNALVPQALRAQNPGSPENVAKQVAADAEWYAGNYSQAQNRYLDLLAS